MIGLLYFIIFILYEIYYQGRTEFKVKVYN